MKRLLIARHGNTFETNQTPVRVGARTDMPLTQKGKAQAIALGKLIDQSYGLPDAVYAGGLQRAYDTAKFALAAMTVPTEQGLPRIEVLAGFNEIDYGVDEGKTDKEVIARVGKQALKQWDEAAIVPTGWQVTPAELVAHWVGFAQDLIKSPAHTTTLVVTSNGVARFAPHMVGDFAGFKREHRLKMATGALSSFVYDAGQWRVEYWNRRADESRALSK